MSAPTFIQKNLSVLLPVVVSVLVSAGGWLWSISQAKAELAQYREKIEKIEAAQPEIDRTRWTVEILVKDQDKIQSKLDEALRAINGVKSDVRVIASRLPPVPGESIK